MNISLFRFRVRTPKPSSVEKSEVIERYIMASSIVEAVTHIVHTFGKPPESIERIAESCYVASSVQDKLRSHEELAEVKELREEEKEEK